MTLPEELLVRLERAMTEIGYGTATISWAEKGTFIEMQIIEKIRLDKPNETFHG